MTTTDNRPDHRSFDAHRSSVGPVTTSLQATTRAMPTPDSPAGDQQASSHTPCDTQAIGAAGSNFPAGHLERDAQARCAGGDQTEDGSAATSDAATTKSHSSLADPFLALAADVLDDTEHTKNANENRLRQLTFSFADGGFGLDQLHPDVAQLAALVDMLGKIEHQAVLQLQRKMRKHPLGPWVKAQKGVGEKQAARLLAVIGDPYWNTLHDRPRTVSELWAYCGLHVLPASHHLLDAHKLNAGGGSSPAGGDSASERPSTQVDSAGVAARRQKGQKANWSTTAKSRAYLIAESMLRAGNRDVYDKRKANTEGRVHAAPCVRCGPKGKPAQPGSLWSDGHRHADALRITSKELLKGLWREARRLHEGELS